MKRIHWLILVGVISLQLATIWLVRGHPNSFRTNATLVWDYQTNVDTSIGWSFRLYSSTNLTTPMTNWTLIQTIPGNLRTTTIPINVLDGQRFFALTASNWWGETDFSEVCVTEPVPQAEQLPLRLE